MSRESEIMLRLMQLALTIVIFLLGMIVGLEIYKSTHDPYDLNYDGVVDVRDVLRIQKHILEEE